MLIYPLARQIVRERGVVGDRQPGRESAAVSSVRPAWVKGDALERIDRACIGRRQEIRLPEQRKLLPERNKQIGAEDESLVNRRTIAECHIRFAMSLGHTQPDGGMSVVFPPMPPIEAALCDWIEDYRYRSEHAVVILSTQREPGTDLVFRAEPITEVAPPLTKTKIIIVVLKKKIVANGPGKPAIGTLKQSHRRETLKAVPVALHTLENLDGIVGVVGGRPDLKTQTDSLDQRNAQVGVKATAKVRVDSEILRLLGTLEPQKQRQVFKDRTTAWRVTARTEVVARQRGAFIAGAR
jgi:hypothetical protein